MASPKTQDPDALMRAASLDPSAPVDTQLASSMSRALQPTQAEFLDMVKDLCERKHWSLMLLSMLTGAGQSVLNGTNAPSIAVRRCVWYLWMVDIAPDALADITVLLSWGRTLLGSYQMRSTPYLTKVERRRIVLELEKMQGGRTASELAMAYHLTRKTAVHLASLAGYQLSPELPAIPKFLRYGSVWLEVDWSVGLHLVAKQAGRSKSTVLGIRRRLESMEPDVLRAYLKRSGADLQLFSRFLHKAPAGSPEPRPASAPPPPASPGTGSPTG